LIGRTFEWTECKAASKRTRRGASPRHSSRRWPRLVENGKSQVSSRARDCSADERACTLVGASRACRERRSLLGWEKKKKGQAKCRDQPWGTSEYTNRFRLSEQGVSTRASGKGGLRVPPQDTLVEKTLQQPRSYGGGCCWSVQQVSYFFIRRDGVFMGASPTRRNRACSCEETAAGNRPDSVGVFLLGGLPPFLDASRSTAPGPLRARW